MQSHPEWRLRVNVPAVLPRAENFLETDLSRYIEQRIMKLVIDMQKAEAESLNTTLDRIEVPQGLSVRKKTWTMKENFQKYFQGCSFISKWPYWVKCICLFQKIDSMDVLLFIMYVYECPEKGSPNEKTAYISYLDSIRYLSPSRYRKPIYQEMVLGYFAYVKQHGFKSALIWVCPPKKGDDYIIFSHPLEQQTPNEKRLGDWYHEMLANAHKQGIVTEVSNLVNEYLQGNYNRSKDDVALLAVPQFSDDHWVQDSEEKCNLLLNVQKVKPLLEQTDEVESDVSHCFDYVLSIIDLYVHEKTSSKEGRFIRKDVRVAQRLQRSSLGGQTAASVSLVRSVYRR
ncbi:uncharacterized protein [Blastocystis hominis]|uniref:histone acetyltransferase n=1 Tax=Blastocystis hominis TaxID=12968 RepID=D8M903_BLAHO|nr:uncharacterized protein [Blastocystis hominis]CBK24542.2 unnamed protein product [Blastocystis hominis]|eukprot:XP_012898590.1 uncharacterized protein [Blastocystis hominis]